MRESLLQYGRNCSRSSPKHISSASMAAGIKHRPRCGESTHGKQMTSSHYRGVTLRMVQGSQGAHLSLCENLPNMPGSPWGFTTDAAQFTAQLASARLDPSIPNAPVSPNIKTRIHFWGTGSRRETTNNRLFQPS